MSDALRRVTWGREGVTFEYVDRTETLTWQEMAVIKAAYDAAQTTESGASGEARPE